MRTSDKAWGAGLAAIGMLALLVTFGATAAASPASAAAAHSKGGGTYNFKANHPTWNAGNLCNVTANGSTWWCSYSGSSGGHGGWGGPLASPACGSCAPSLSYNFSASHTTIWVNISGLSSYVDRVFLNLKGNFDNLTINISGCRGGSLNLTLLGERNVVNFDPSASDVRAGFQLFLDHNAYNVNMTGRYDSAVTDFSGAAPQMNTCPWANSSRTDRFSAVGWGSADYQQFVWANTNGYNTNLSFTHMAGANNSGSWGSKWFSANNTVGWENTTSLVCHWAKAPSCSRSSSGGGGGWNEARRSE